MDQDDQEETHFSAHMYKNTRIGTGSGIPAINQDAIELQTTRDNMSSKVLETDNTMAEI